MPFPGLGQMSAMGYANTFIPGYMGDGASQKRLLVGYTLNEERWALNNYVTVFGVDKPTFYYPKFNSQDFVRMPHASGVDQIWADGADIPKAQENPRFTNIRVDLKSYAVKDFIGEKAEDVSDLGSLIKIMQETFATQAMIRRSVLTQTLLTTSTNFPTDGTTHYYAKWGVLANAAVSLGYQAGYFGSAGSATGYDGTLDDPIFKKMVTHAQNLILLRSNGVVTPQDLCIVMNPLTAGKLAASREIRAYNAQQVNSIDYTKSQGDFPSWPGLGLPTTLYGLKVIVDPTTKNTSKQDHATGDSQSYVVGNGVVQILARPGSVSGMAGSASYGSVAIFQNKKWAMKPETHPDPVEHRTQVNFFDMFATELTGPEISFVIADIGDPATS